MVIFLVITGAALCCGLCAYGIGKSVRRSRKRRDQKARQLTGP
jgi:hypothetical protein